jgi:hypothetical protein
VASFIILLLKPERAQFPFSTIVLAFLWSAIPALGQSSSNSQKSIVPGTLPSYQPITGTGRLKWFGVSTFGPESWLSGVVSAGWGTLFNSPEEYGPHWEGFGKRYGIRFTGVSTGNAMEAGFGAIWGEDPRYFRAEGRPFKSRVGYVVKMTFMAHNSSGREVPAYARFIAVPGNNFLSNTWRAQSEADVSHALERTLTGFLGEMASDAFAEFWPDVRDLIFQRNKGKSAPLLSTGHELSH